MKRTIRGGPTPEAWNPDALRAKAERYAERMFRHGTDDSEKALWSSLALELLARAALANIHPTLLAECKDSTNLIHSLGFEPKKGKFTPTSIAIAQAVGRLNELVPNFIEEHKDFCIAHTGRRNAELHSGETPFDALKGWEAKFYRACVVLLKSMGLKLADFIGDEHADTAEKMIVAETDKSAKAVLKDVAAFEKKWAGLDEKARKDLATSATAWATRQAGHRVKCPACASPSLVIGEPIAAPERTIKEDQIIETQNMLPYQFECIACGLKIVGLSRLNVVGLGDRYKKTHVYDPYEYFSDNNYDTYFDDDNNEPF